MSIKKKKLARIYGKMAEKGITQRELSGKMGLASSTLNMKLNGKTEFTVGEIFRISKSLDIPKEDIVSYFF
jgi:transcriptional regulator with XRE-family HTH domain